MPSRRQFVVGCSVVAIPGLSGCIGSSESSSESQQLLDIYEDAYNHHLDGYENFERGIDAYHSEEDEQAESRFEDAISEYERAREIIDDVDEDTAELMIEAFDMDDPDDFPEEYRRVTSAVSGATVTLSFLVERVSRLGNEPERRSDMDEFISNVEDDLSNGEYSMPRPDQFEQILE